MKLSPLVLLAALPAAIQAQNDMDCATAAEDADCVTCLTEGCVLTVGQCISSCSFIADASCWDMQYHEGKTVEEVCNIKATQEADDQICGAESDCGACTSTAKTNGGTCEWYVVPEGPGYCGAGGCGFAGICGSTTCEDGDTTTAIQAQNDINCATAAEDADCVTCLTEGCVLTVGQCISSCDFIADASCWDMQYHEGKTVEEVCNEKAVIEADEDICGAEALQSDCGACTSTAKTNGGTCEWYVVPEGPGYCGAGGCGFAGICGSTTCEGGDTTTPPAEEDDHPCNGFDLCEPCLNSRIECAWVGGACEPSCDAAPEAVCYHPGQEAFAGMVGPDICAAAEEAGDAKPEETTATATEDEHPCHGFELCEPCLNSRIECAWVGGICEPSCDAAPEEVCYHPGQEAFAGMIGPDICAVAKEAGDAKPTADLDKKESNNSTDVDGVDVEPLESSAAHNVLLVGSVLSVGLAAVALL